MFSHRCGFARSQLKPKNSSVDRSDLGCYSPIGLAPWLSIDEPKAAPDLGLDRPKRSLSLVFYWQPWQSSNSNEVG